MINCWNRFVFAPEGNVPKVSYLIKICENNQQKITQNINCETNIFYNFCFVYVVCYSAF